METLPHLSTWAGLAFEINSAIESGRCQPYSFHDFYKSLDDNRVLEDVENLNAGIVDFGLIPDDREERDSVNKVLQDLTAGLRGRESGKVGIQSSGLHLFIAYIIEAMQCKLWV